MDSDNDSTPEAVISKKKAKKVSAARQQQADAEKPEIKPSTANPQKGKNAVTSGAQHPGTEASWDITTRLALPALNKEIGMTAQHPELQFVLRNSISLVKIFVLFVNAYLPQVTRAGTARPFIIEAAEIRHASHFILERLLADPGFGTILAPIVLDRTNLLRGGMKRCAGNCVLAFYGLVDLDAEKMKTRIEELLQDHRYIFPTDPKTGQLQLDKPFRHGSIRFVLKEEIFSSPSFVSQNIDRFPARYDKKPDERECPDAMVALAATAVYAALVEYRMTGQRQTIAFTEDAYQGTHNNHIATLEQVRENAPRATHKVLHELFKEVGASNKAANAASGSSAALIHLVDLPESD
ncbi:hypothetical protein C8R43DRAFT_1136719 [Mycena crocata]|nr:hypothetical protein C8R43DRAFT_1136719 [Mycena crocata]